MATYRDIRALFEQAMNEAETKFQQNKEGYLVKNRQSGTIYRVQKVDLKTHVPPSKEEVVAHANAEKEEQDAAKNKQTSSKTLHKSAEKINKMYSGFKDQVAFENDEDQKSFEKAFASLLTGGELEKDQQDVVNKYFKIAKKDREFAIYMASKEPGNFKQNARLKIELGDSVSAKEFKEKLLAAGVEETDPSTTGADALKVASKDVAPNKINKKSVQLKREIEKEGDEVQSVKFGSHSIKRLQIPADLKGNLKKAYPKATDKELAAIAERISVSIERNNTLLENMANMKGEIEVLETIEGADVSTKEGRDKVLAEYPNKLADALAEKLGDKPTKAEAQLLEDLRKLKDVESPEDYEKAAVAIIDKMNSIDSIRKGSSDLAESIAYLNMTKRGYPVYLPSSANMTVSDIVSFPDLSDLDPEDPDYSKKLASNIQYTVSLQNQGGLSVKKDGGAASAARAKLEQTLFKNEKTREKLTAIVDNYENVMGSVTRKPDHKLAEENLANIEKWAKDAGLWDGKPIDAGANGKTTADWANDQIKIWSEKGKLKGSKEHIETVRKSLELHAKQALLLAHVHNNDCRGQLFGNANLDTKKGRIDMTDGIETASLMKPLLNSGYSFREDKEGNVWPTPVNVYAANLDHGIWDDEKQVYVPQKH